MREKNFFFTPQKFAALSMPLIVIIYRILVIILGGVELWIREKNAKNPFIFKLFSNVEKRIKFVEERWKKNVDKWKKKKIVGKWTGQI